VRGWPRINKNLSKDQPGVLPAYHGCVIADMDCQCTSAPRGRHRPRTQEGKACQEDRGIPKPGTGEDMPRKPLDRHGAGRTGTRSLELVVTINGECLQLSPFWRFNFLHFCLQLSPKSACKKQSGSARCKHGSTDQSVSENNTAGSSFRSRRFPLLPMPQHRRIGKGRCYGG